MLCPYCEYGMILKERIKDIDKEIYICEECDTVWEEEINDKTGVGFAKYMKKIGKCGSVFSVSRNIRMSSTATIPAAA